MDYLETIYSILIILRIYSVGLAFLLYCNYHEKEPINSVIGAIIYTFCGFVLFAGIRHPYFTNALILLPLTFLGIDKLLKENKKIFLILIVFISAISNYYFFYMIIIINAIYAITKYVTEYNTGIKDFAKKFKNVIISYGIGILMASIFFLPNIYAFLNSARLEYMETWKYEPNFYFNFIEGLITIKHSNWTIISLSSIVLLMIPILFTKLKEKESKTYAKLLVITTIMLLIPNISSVMNGFSSPNNRWVFAYSFILSYIVTLCFKREGNYEKRQKNVMAISLAIYIILITSIIILNKSINIKLYINLIICTIILAVLLLEKNNNKIINYISNNRQIIIIPLIIININIIAQELYRDKEYVNQFLVNDTQKQLSDTLRGKMECFKEAIEYIKQNDNELYRISKCDNTIDDSVLHKNASLIYDYHPIQGYLSIGNRYVYNLSRGLEDSTYNVTNNINGMDRRTKITTLLGTKYYICNGKDKGYIPYGYSLKKQIGDTQIYFNENYLPLGIVYDNYITKEKYDKLTPLEREEALLNTAVLEENIGQVEENKEIEIQSPISLPYISEEEIKENKIEVVDKNKIIYLKTNEMKENCEIYLSIKNLQYQSEQAFMMTAYFNQIISCERVAEKISPYYEPNSDFLINLGISKSTENNMVAFNLNNVGTYTFDSIEILAVPMDKYENQIQNLRNNEMKNIVYGNNFIKGKVNIDKNSILQITTSYSNGWKAYIDGKEQDTIKVNEGFIGTIIEKGEHEIEFRYTTPYLDIGIICTSIGTLSLIVIIIVNHTKRKTDLI